VTENYLLVKDAWKINGSAFMIDENFRLASNVGPRKSDVFASKTRKRVKDAEKSLLFESFHRNQTFSKRKKEAKRTQFKVMLKGRRSGI